MASSLHLIAHSIWLNKQTYLRLLLAGLFCIPSSTLSSKTPSNIDLTSTWQLPLFALTLWLILNLHARACDWWDRNVEAELRKYERYDVRMEGVMERYKAYLGVMRDIKARRRD